MIIEAKNRPQEPEMSSTQKSPKIYDFIIALGASIRFNAKTQLWEYPTIVEEAPEKVWAGRARIIAASIAYRRQLAPKLIITGGMEIHEGVTQSRPQLFLKFLTEKYKVSKEWVVEAGGNKGSTRGNFEDSLSYMDNNRDLIVTGEVGVITNDWHFDRALETARRLGGFEDRGIRLCRISAEELMISESPHYKRWVDCVDATPQMAIRRQMEQQGLRDLQEGKYVYVNH